MSNTRTPEEVKSTIRSIEDNSQSRHNDGAKQSIVQNVKNSSTLGGSNAFEQGHKGGKQ
jgi:hypothetical protein